MLDDFDQPKDSSTANRQSNFVLNDETSGGSFARCGNLSLKTLRALDERNGGHAVAWQETQTA